MVIQIRYPGGVLGNWAGRGPLGVASTRLGLAHVGIVSPL